MVWLMCKRVWFWQAKSRLTASAMSVREGRAYLHPATWWRWPYDRVRPILIEVTQADIDAAIAEIETEFAPWIRRFEDEASRVLFGAADHR